MGRGYWGVGCTVLGVVWGMTQKSRVRRQKELGES